MDAAGPIVVVRLAQYVATAVLFGAPLFLLSARGLGDVSAARRPWPRGAVVAAAALSVAATLAWVELETASMSGDVKAAVDPGALWAFLSETPFGRAALARTTAAGLALIVLIAAPRAGRGGWSAVAGLGAVAVASLAWSGHGASDEGVRGLIHLIADVSHLLAAAAWVGALPSLLSLVFRSTRSGSPPDIAAAEAALAGFSGVGTALVAVLLLSGAVNSWFLIGPTHVGALLTTAYGRLLTAKLVLFGAMLCLAAANRYWLTPRLTGAPHRSTSAKAALAALRVSVLLELSLAVLVLALVSWLGTLTPPSG